MIFFLNLILSLIFCYISKNEYQYRNVSTLTFIFLFFPIIICWLLICGGQYNVGTDYWSYLEIFRGRALDRYEPGFIVILKTFWGLGLSGQGLFYVFYLIGFILLFLFIRKSDLYEVGIFILLYICVTNLFNNQLNGLRQTIAIYLGSLGCVIWIRYKLKKSIFLLLVAISIHYAAMIFSVIWIFPIYKKLRSSNLYVLLLLGFIGAFVIKGSMLIPIINIVPSIYSYYVVEHSLDSAPFLNVFTKLLLLPLYILSIFNLKKYKLKLWQRYLFNLGIIGYSFKLLLSNLITVSRLSDFFLLLSVFPLYYLIVYYKSKKYFAAVCVIYLFFIGMYAVKTIVFPTAEYKYSSIYNFIF